MLKHIRLRWRDEPLVESWVNDVNNLSDTLGGLSLFEKSEDLLLSKLSMGQSLTEWVAAFPKSGPVTGDDQVTV